MDETITIMNDEPLISAIIIFLNGEKFLEEAIKSVIDQTYTNWELLLVDDGSTDGSTDIALSYTKTWASKIKYLEHENHQNKGMSATRNLGIKNAKGEFIGFLDADDVWLPDKLIAQVAIFKKYPQCDMVYGRTQIWYSWTNNLGDQKKDHFFPLGVKPDTLIDPPKIALLILENKVQSPTTCNVLIKKNVFEKAGLFLENFKGMFEDAAFFCKATLIVSVYVSDSTWARYRQHDESCSSIASKANSDEQARYNFLEWFKSYLDSKKIFSTKLRFALYREMFPYRHKFLYYFISTPFKLSKRLIRKSPSRFKN
jgi:glycosyltransferase involved in cell wall biosynthesis